jgi:hypothetical protein
VMGMGFVFGETAFLWQGFPDWAAHTFRWLREFSSIRILDCPIGLTQRRNK